MGSDRERQKRVPFRRETVDWMGTSITNNNNNDISLLYISLYFASHYAFTNADVSQHHQIAPSQHRVEELAYCRSSAPCPTPWHPVSLPSRPWPIC